MPGSEPGDRGANPCPGAIFSLPIVYAVGHQAFNLANRVQAPVGRPFLQIQITWQRGRELLRNTPVHQEAGSNPAEATHLGKPSTLPDLLRVTFSFSISNDPAARHGDTSFQQREVVGSNPTRGSLLFICPGSSEVER